jgi:capsular polysaccharide transport system permease protein
MTIDTLPSRGHETLWSALQRQIRVVGALILRETRTRFGHSRLGYLWALLEPVMHMLGLSVIYITLMRQPLTGTSIVLFFLSGIMPYFLFYKTATQIGGAINANRALLHLALVKHVDVILARALLELGNLLIVFGLLMMFLRAFNQFGNTEIDILLLAKAGMLMWFIGLGVGMINAVLSTLVKSWATVFSIATRPLYLLSGVFFLAERLPPAFGKWLAYNPILHGVEYFRSGIYPGYGRTFIDMGYLMGWAIVPLVIGLAFMRLMRRKLSAKIGTG